MAPPVDVQQSPYAGFMPTIRLDVVNDDPAESRSCASAR